MVCPQAERNKFRDAATKIQLQLAEMDNGDSGQWHLGLFDRQVFLKHGNFCHGEIKAHPETGH